MTEKLSLLFRAQIIAGTAGWLTSSVKHKRLEQIALRELNEAVDQAIDEFTELLKK